MRKRKKERGAGAEKGKELETKRCYNKICHPENRTTVYFSILRFIVVVVLFLFCLFFVFVFVSISSLFAEYYFVLRKSIFSVLIYISFCFAHSGQITSFSIVKKPRPTKLVLQLAQMKQSLCQCRSSNEMNRVPPIPNGKNVNK